MLCLGVDPGQHYGFALLRFEVSPILRMSLDRTTVLHRRDRATPDASDLATVEALEEALAAYQAEGLTLIAAEQPVDAKPFWQSQKGGRREGTGTSFRSGAYYGMLVAAVARLRPRVPFVSFPVHRHEGRTGWMPAKTPRGRLLHGLRTAMGMNAAEGDWSDHEVMAYGVARAGVVYYVKHLYERPVTAR